MNDAKTCYKCGPCLFCEFHIWQPAHAHMKTKTTYSHHFYAFLGIPVSVHTSSLNLLQLKM